MSSSTAPPKPERWMIPVWARGGHCHVDRGTPCVVALDLRAGLDRVGQDIGL